jgi:hypothetical protein
VEVAADAERITRQGVEPSDPASLGEVELDEAGAIWELLSFHKGFSSAVDELSRKLETVLKPEPETNDPLAAAPMLESPLRSEIRAIDHTLERLRYLISRLDL